MSLFGLERDERLVKAAAELAVNDFLREGKMPPDGRSSLEAAVRLVVKPGCRRGWQGAGFTASVTHERGGEVHIVRWDAAGLQSYRHVHETQPQ